MLIYYKSDGVILAVIEDREQFRFERTHSINVPFSIYLLDDTTTNGALIVDVGGKYTKMDTNGQSKYYINTVTEELMEREGWESRAIGWDGL